jgi:hypothetical protein
MNSSLARSISVLTNLTDVAKKCIEAMEESAAMAAAAAAATATATSNKQEKIEIKEKTTITKTFLPSSRRDPQRSEQDDFFLPFDQENDDDNNNYKITIHDDDNISATPTTTAPKTQWDQQQQKQREAAAVMSFEEFFLLNSLSQLQSLSHSSIKTKGQSLSNLSSNDNIITASPVSTMEFHSNNNEGLTSLKQKGNILAEEGLLLPQRHTSGGSNISSNNNNNSQVLLLAPLSQSQQQQNRQRHSSPVARKLVTAAISIPTSTSSTFPRTPTLKRRSSLKKVSSYGNISQSIINSVTPTSPSTFPSSLQSSPQLKRNVSFGNMQIRQYNVAISDHPSCSHGPPIQLSWEYDKEKVISVPLESYEKSRTTDGDNPRRERKHLLLSLYERHFLLMKQGGCSKHEIKETMKEVERVKRERMMTDLFLPASPFDETMENIINTVKNMFAVTE